MKRLIVLVLAVGFLVSACVPAPPPNTGIEGLATFGPISPVQREGEPGSRPYAGVFVVHPRGSDRTVAEIHTAEDGRFRLLLAPGEYTIDLRGGSAPPSMAPVDVVVRRGEYTRVELPVDSGIR